jgi:putative endonuclease
VTYTVYAIRSIAKNYIYVGLTNNLERRLNEHNRGHERTTRAYAPFRLLHTQLYATRQAARNREKFLKSGAGKELLKSLL